VVLSKDIANTGSRHFGLIRQSFGRLVRPEVAVSDDLFPRSRLRLRGNTPDQASKLPAHHTQGGRQGWRASC
jgi:hypothetical protein